jgi:hypothetical protein
VAAAHFQRFGGLRPTFPGYWVFSAKLYHKLLKANDPKAVQKSHDYFLEHCRTKLTNDPDFDAKISAYSKRLDHYIDDYVRLNQPTVRTNKRVQFNGISGHMISGSIGRLDILPVGGFAATNFELRASDWKTHLRTALIQKALADELCRDLTEIQVGMYCIQSGNHEYVSLSDREIEKAVAESAVVVNAVDGEIKRLRRAKS